MEYDRIHNVQTGIISPSKLRMMLHHPRNKYGSNRNSSRTSPSKLEDNEFLKNSLLTSNSGNFDEEVVAPSSEVTPAKPSGDKVLYPGRDNQATFCKPKESLPRENKDAAHIRSQQLSRSDVSNPSMVHPVRPLEVENVDYDSYASSSSFEFGKGEKSHNHMARSYSRPMSSKWNDAEKWIMSRQILEANNCKKFHFLNQASRLPVTNTCKVAPELAYGDHKLLMSRIADTKLVDFCLAPPKTGLEKFSFVPFGSHSISGQASGGNAVIHPCPPSKDLKEVGTARSHTTGTPAIRQVSMRDMGTEMTPGASLEPSRTATPEGATTPLGSPIFSNPSTPRSRAPASSPMEHSTGNESQQPTGNIEKELSAEELKIKTRREIIALGVQLGKTNIAAWASKEEQEKNTNAETIKADELKQIEIEKRAAAWEEAQKSRHTARCKREEIKIQAWESQQRAKLEAEIHRVEAQVEQMRAEAQAKIVKKIGMTRQKLEVKRALAEARKNRNAERSAAEAEYIRRTG